MLARTVLVVEDDAPLRAAALRVFRKAGFETEVVETADQAVSFVFERADCLAFIFADVHTPGTMNGIGLARLVRTHWPHVDVVITSGEVVDQGALPAGVRFKPKPWHASELLDLARAAVDRVRALEEA